MKNLIVSLVLVAGFFNLSAHEYEYEDENDACVVTTTWNGKQYTGGGSNCDEAYDELYNLLCDDGWDSSHCN